MYEILRLRAMGYAVALHGNQISCRPPEGIPQTDERLVTHLLTELRSRETEAIAWLKRERACMHKGWSMWRHVERCSKQPLEGQITISFGRQQF